MLGRDEISADRAADRRGHAGARRRSSSGPSPSRRGQIRDQIEIGSGPDYRTYQVQLTREGTMAEIQGLCGDPRRHHRPAVGAAHRRLGRRGAPHRARDQEPADADPALGRAPAPALWRASSPTISRSSTNASTPSCGRSAISAAWSTSSRPSPACPRPSPQLADLSETVRAGGVPRKRPAARDRDQRWSCRRQPVSAWFDQRLISQVLTNLIKNAVEAIEGVGLEADQGPGDHRRGAERGRQGARRRFPTTARAGRRKTGSACSSPI